MTQEWTGRHWITGDPIAIEVEDGVITSVEPSEEQTDLWIGPGLIDVQVNGMGGFNINDEAASPENIYGALSALHRGGVTRFCPTVVTAPTERLLASLRSIYEACSRDEDTAHAVIGIHVEGPFISHEDGPRGAHNAAWVRDPTWEEFLLWQDAAGGLIRKVTIAPERAGALAFIEKLTDHGVIAAIGHTSASVDQVRDAVVAGASMSTHLGNGAHPYIRRHPNYIWAQLAEDTLWAGLIPDGFHLPPTTLKVMIRVKGKKAILTSDGTYLAQMEPGRYNTHHGIEVVLEEDGRLYLADSPDILAGSAVTLHRGIQNVANFGIASLGAAIDMASLHPAELFGLEDQGAGTIRVGGVADFMTYRWQLEPAGNRGEMLIQETIARGKTKFAA